MQIKRGKSSLVKQVNKDGHAHWRVSRKMFNSVKKALKLFCLCVW